MRKFRQRLQTVEAIQYDGSIECGQKIIEWAKKDGKGFCWMDGFNEINDPLSAERRTLMYGGYSLPGLVVTCNTPVHISDYVVRDAFGSFEVCTPRELSIKYEEERE